MPKLNVIVMGYVVRGPLGGMAWSDLQYLASLRALGHDVAYVEDSDDYPSCYDPRSDEMTVDPTYGLTFARDALDSVGLGDRWSYFDAHSQTWHGPLAPAESSVFSEADVLLNLAGVNPLREWALQVPVRILVDQDPAFTQIKNLTDPVRAAFTRDHTSFATFAVNIAEPDCSIPDDGIPWRPTRQPVLVERFSVTETPAEGAFTSVMQWESYPALEFEGHRYGMKSDSFEEYLMLPEMTTSRLELAIGAPSPVRARLEAAGWKTFDPRGVTRSTATYETFIRASKGEIGLAKHGYATTGWFSERSLAYMCNSRPVVLQDTGFTRWLPVTEGVLAFDSPAEAAEQLAAAERDHRHHGRAAREAAIEHFDGRAVIRDLLQEAIEAARPNHLRGSRGI